MDKEMDEEINYRILREIQQSEKKSPKLSNIKPGFYKYLSEYIQKMEKRLEKEDSTQKKKLLEDEIENTRKIAENIYEQREKKILLAAISKARGGHPNLENLVEAEKNLFDSILEKMKKTREDVFKIEEEKEEKEDKKSENSKKEDKKKLEHEKPVILIKKDIPEFIGTDKKKYNLKQNDIVSLSKDMCEMLSKRDVANQLKI